MRLRLCTIGVSMRLELQDGYTMRGNRTKMKVLGFCCLVRDLRGNKIDENSLWLERMWCVVSARK